MANPKSYSTWHHRFWAFENHPAPNLQKELGLCEKALMMDCRNFHCWDHRRSVAKLAKLTDEDELAFSDKLQRKPPSKEGCLDEEMKKIMNVCCVNSEDQTAWTYSRWLQEAACDHDQAPVTVLSATNLTADLYQIVLSRAVGINDVRELVKPQSEATLQPVSLMRAPREDYQSAYTWLVQVSHAQDGIHVRSNNDAGEWTSVTIEKPYVDKAAIAKIYSAEPLCNSPKAREALHELANLCKELMQMEEEQDNPSEVISLSRTLLFLEGPSKQTVDTILAHFETIKRLDPYRKNMYDELADRLRVTAALHERGDETKRTVLENLLEGGVRLSIRGGKISSVNHLRFLSGLIRDLNLQNNHVTDLAQFRVFPALKSLDVSENPIKRIPSSFKLPNLEFLNLASTHVDDPNQLAPLRQSDSLRRLLICSTKLVDNAERVVDVLDPKSSGLRIIFHYL
ncbi:Protein M57.2 [Aphelenchoides avenae]|nr:Protein M57.2 [Aphelenchus avenae]